MARPRARRKGEWAYRGDGSRIFVPDQKITHVKQATRYCALPLRGWGFTRAVIDTAKRRAVGYLTIDDGRMNLPIRVCNDNLMGARRRGMLGAHKPTIYEALRERLRREPTNPELKAEVSRIKNDAYVALATRGGLRHQRRRR